MLNMQDGEYHVGNLLNSPTDVEETVEVALPDGQPVTAQLFSGEEGITAQITGTVMIDDICARCGEPLQLKVNLGGELIDTEIVNGRINLSTMAQDEVELARPTLAYCQKCQQLKNN